MENNTMRAFTLYSDLSNPPVEQSNMTGAFVNQGPAMIHQQQETLDPQQFNAAYSLPTSSGSQLNEIRAVNGVFHLRWTNQLPYGAAHLRPQGPPQLSNQPQQSQVLLWNAQGPAELSGLSDASPTLQRDGAEFTPSTMVGRGQPLDDGQINQAQVMPYVLHPHQSNQASSVIASRSQEVGCQHQPTHVQIVPTVVANSMVQTPSMLPRFPPVQLEDLTASVHTTPTDGNSQHGMPEKRACKRRPSSAQGHEPGESSRVSNKRQRNSTNSDDQDAFIPSNPREVINGCYNPIYNKRGLPLDLHIRLLEASLKKEFSPE